MRALADARQGPADGVRPAGPKTGRHKRVKRLDVDCTQAGEDGCGSSPHA
jgi:hypothetical protein